MRKRLIGLTFLLLACGITQSTVAQQKQVADKIIAVIGNSMVTYSELQEAIARIREQQIKEGYTPQRDLQSEALEQLLMQRLLANQARLDSLSVNVAGIMEEVNTQVNRMVEKAGSLQNLEHQQKKAIFQIKDDMQKRYEDMYYAQSMQQEIAGKVTITPSEVERYYKKMAKEQLPVIPEQYIYRQIVMYPSTIKEAKLRTRERLLELRERIIKGEKFAVLARLYSDDKASATRGGEMDPMPLSGLVKPFADALEKLSPGQVSPVVETEFGFHIIQLLDKQGDLYRACHILMRPSYTKTEMEVTYNRLDSIAKAIRVDSISFNDAAMRYSEDKYSRLNGGIVSNQEMLAAYNVNNAKATSIKFLKEELREDYYTIRNLTPGEISSPVEATDFKGNTLTKIISLEKVIPSHQADLNEDYIRLEEVALQDKQSRIFDEWLDKKIAAMYVKLDPEYRNSDFKYKGWVK